jgi:hypothetical protein
MHSNRSWTPENDGKDQGCVRLRQGLILTGFLHRRSDSSVVNKTPFSIWRKVSRLKTTDDWRGFSRAAVDASGDAIRFTF